MKKFQINEYLVLGITLALILAANVAIQVFVIAETGTLKRGFSGYVTSKTALQTTIGIMESQNLNAYRVSFRPSWHSQGDTVKSYNTAYIDYLLANTDYLIIVDGNHLYPATEEVAKDARAHWSGVKDRVFQVLEDYPNNPRVAVELINEYASDDYDERMQNLIDEIRAAEYTNPIVTNKLYTPWHKFSDPLDNTYQGTHFFFNSWSADGAMRQMEIAKSRGITKIINTEVGASYNEYRDYTQANVDELETFLIKSQALGIGNCVWMNNDAVNWQGYSQYNLCL